MANNYYDLQYTGNKVIQWKNYSDTSTPLSAANLQKSHQAINDVDQAVRAAFQNVDNTKFDKTNAAQMLSGVTYNDQTGVMVFKHYDNSIPDIIFNTNLQKLVVNFSYDPNTQSLLLTQSDGTIVSVDLSAFVSNPDLTNSNTIAWTINQDGSVSANIINNSITDEMMESHYLASIMTIGGQAQQSALNADYNAKLAKSYANGTSGLPDRPNEHIDNADYYRQLAHGYASISGSYMRIAGEKASDSEAYGAGTRDGIPVSSDDPAYHNNSKFYMEEAKEAVIKHLPVMTGATATTDGQQGAAPKPLAGQQDDLLTGGAQYKSLDELGIQKRVLASSLTIGGQVVTEVEEALNALNENSGGTDDYTDLQNKPQVNGNSLIGNKTGSQLGLQNVVLASALTIGGQVITEVEEALNALNENSSAGHTILDEDGTTYPQRSKLQFEGCEVTDDAVNGVTVVKCEGGGVKKYAKPTITVGTYTYDGTTQAPTITGFDANVMTLTGTHEAINAGSYTFTIALSDKTSSKWTDDTQADIVTSWSISKANSNTTASASSVSLNTSNTSRTVTLSNVTGTVTVSSSNTSVATASVNNNTVTITGVNYKDGSATITISIAASTNYKAKTLTVSVSASYKSTITVTLYSAASDTVSFTDDAGSKTAVTDTSGKKTSVSIVIPYNGKTITFTSSVAKNPSNLSNAYSKSITLTRSTTKIKVMPDGVLYWWGYDSGNLKQASSSWCPWNPAYTAKSVTYNTQNIQFGPCPDEYYIGVTSKDKVACSTINVINSRSGIGGEGWCVALCTNTSSAMNSQTYRQYINTATSAMELTTYSAVQGNYYPAFETCNGNRTGVCYALWYE